MALVKFPIYGGQEQRNNEAKVVLENSKIAILYIFTTIWCFKNLLTAAGL